jgi:hypothetical protein
MAKKGQMQHTVDSWLGEIRTLPANSILCALLRLAVLVKQHPNEIGRPDHLHLIEQLLQAVFAYE